MSDKRMIEGVIGGSRFVIGLAVLASFIGSVVLLVASIIAVLVRVWTEISNFSPARYTPNHVEHLGVQFIQLTDIILLGTVMYIVSLGLYQLFIDQTLPLPRWLRVRDLIELKRDLLGVTVVLLGVTFLGKVVDWDEGSDILILGAAVALVVAALGFVLWLSPGLSASHDDGPEPSPHEVHGRHAGSPPAPPVSLP